MKQSYVVDLRGDMQRRVETLNIALEVDTPYDDAAMGAVRNRIIAWCERNNYEFCGHTVAVAKDRPAARDVYVMARVRALAGARVPKLRNGRPIGDPIERPAPTMAARRRGMR